ncbi:hypothetical protein RHMOL_Rhmol04G0177000 [Rhododendron molle]|uniref:Uncharacterized protein n=1 Tax=Rhododendron molle TaxID=49168 RepID=A0ACC0P1G7_RHOML|nr:hypothetical protein RHMOL_Rhmol04G0177000 [Rhododendron molle]
MVGSGTWVTGMSRQSVRLDAFLVPRPLLPLVQRTSSYTLREIERFTQLNPELEPLFQAGTDYAEYQAQYLMKSFGVHAAWEVAQQARGG